MKVFLGLKDIAGFYTGLRHGFADLGVDCTLVDLSSTPFRYGGDSRSRLAEASRNGWRGQRGSRRAARALLLGRSLLAYDAFILSGTSTFVSFGELKLLNALGKRIIYVFHGSDSRPPYIGKPSKRALSEHPSEWLEAIRRRKAAVQRIEQAADFVVSNPFSSHFIERPFIRSHVIGTPRVLPDEVIQDPRSPRQAVRVLHAPSDPEVKGTPRIHEAIDILRANRTHLDYVEIVGRSNDQVMRELAECDFVVDQLYSDTPLAGFASEAAAFGKPAIVGSYAAAEFARVLSPREIGPAHLCHPEGIAGAIDLLSNDDAYRRDLGKRARSFIEEYWDAKKVALRFMQLLQGDVPDDWYCDPRDIRYLHGAGIAEDTARLSVMGVLQAGGTAALQLSDKPELEKAFVDFAHVSPSSREVAPDSAARR